MGRGHSKFQNGLDINRAPGGNQKFLHTPMTNSTPKNINAKIEESQTQKKSGTSKMQNDILNIDTVAVKQVDDQG